MATGWPLSDDSWNRMRREYEEAEERSRKFKLSVVEASIDVALDTGDRDWFMMLTHLQKELTRT